MSGPSNGRTRRRTRLNVPREARAGDVIEIKTIISHPMETGLRRGDDGLPIPQHTIQRFECLFDGRRVFMAELHTGIAADPFLAFFLRATRSGVIEFLWHDDTGVTYRESATLRVVPA